MSLLAEASFQDLSQDVTSPPFSSFPDYSKINEEHGPSALTVDDRTGLRHAL